MFLIAQKQPKQKSIVDIFIYLFFLWDGKMWLFAKNWKKLQTKTIQFHEPEINKLVKIAFRLEIQLNVFLPFSILFYFNNSNFLNVYDVPSCTVKNFCSRQ